MHQNENLIMLLPPPNANILKTIRTPHRTDDKGLNT